LVRDLATFQAPMMAWVWIGILTFTTYFLAGHMREQVCIYMCPWPRIQAALTDDDALNVTYRFDRGEPRLSLKAAKSARDQGAAAGDCIDCLACVHACPTGVDIRKGADLACIQCGLCIDACDRMMEKVDRPTGLIGYDTMKAVDARAAGLPIPKARIIRPRTLLYMGLIGAIGLLMLATLATRGDMTFASQHERNPLFATLKDGSIRNAYTLTIGNKAPEAQTFRLAVEGVANANFSSEDADTSQIEVGPDQTRRLRIFIETPSASLAAASNPIRLILINDATAQKLEIAEHIIGP
jgi:cytochrome c oxidase accessory protein FixG